MATALTRQEVRRAIFAYLDARFPDQVVDERGDDDTAPPDAELYPFWIAMAPEPLRVHVSREALDHVAGIAEDADAVAAWLDGHALAETIARGRDVLVTSGGVATAFEPE